MAFTFAIRINNNNMKKIAFLILAALCILQGTMAQKPLTKAAIKDFAAVCWYNYRFGNTQFIATMNTFLPYNRSEVAAIMEGLETDPKGREKVFEVFYRVSSGNYESLFSNLYSLKLTATTAKEIANYIIAKNDPETASLFTGTKKFTDGDGWNYIVTFQQQNKVVIKLYPSANNEFYKDKTKPKRVVTGTLQDGLVKSGEHTYCFKGGKLYEANFEGGWNEYSMVSN